MMLVTLLFAELSSVALDGRIVAVSDEFFAEAFHLLLVEVSETFLVSNSSSDPLYSQRPV